MQHCHIFSYFESGLLKVVYLNAENTTDTCCKSLLLLKFWSKMIALLSVSSKSSGELQYFGQLGLQSADWIFQVLFILPLRMTNRRAPTLEMGI